MRWIAPIALWAMFLCPAVANDQAQRDELAACVIGHAAVTIVHGIDDVEMAEQAAWDVCKSVDVVEFASDEEAETFEEYILDVLHRVAGD